MKSDREIMRSIRSAIDACTRGIDDAPSLQYQIARKAKGEEPVKKRVSAAFVLGIVLGLVLIGTAYAMFSSQTADFFARYWNKELGESLQKGKIAQIGESVTIGDVVFTLDEIVYKNRALFGVGKARPVNEKDVILPMDMVHDPEFFAMSEEAQALAEKARAAGGRMLTVSSTPEKISVDEGAMLRPGSIGYYDVANDDGSVIFSFDASDGFAVNEGTSYQILMESEVEQVDEKGEIIMGTMQRSEWTVTCEPAVMNEETDKAESSDSNVSAIEKDGYELLVPPAYQETGTLPVYRAEEVNFTAFVKPEWFNNSGIQDDSERTAVHFNDHAMLFLSPESVSYGEFADDQYGETHSTQIVDIEWIRRWEDHIGEFMLEKTALSGITLDEAEAQAEELMGRLGIDCNAYELTDSVDLSLDRIQTLGGIWEKAVADGALLVDEDYQPYDYASIPATEEGFFLRYAPFGVDTSAAGERYSVQVFINSRGIVYANIRNPFNKGEIMETPQTLITPDEAIDRLAKEMERSVFDHGKTIKAVQQAALIYQAIRAENKSEGMVFAPVWMILYQDEAAILRHYSCYALFNAMDGTLIDASFR